MATITPTISNPRRGLCKVTWAAGKTGDTFVAATGLGEWAGPRAVQIEGTFDSDTVTLLGSLDGINFRALNKTPGGSAISATAAGLQPVGELADQYKPAMAGGAGSGVLAVTLLLTGHS